MDVSRYGGLVFSLALLASMGTGCGAPDHASTVKEFGLYKSIVYTSDNVDVHIATGPLYTEAFASDMLVLSEEELRDYVREDGEQPVRLVFEMEWSAVPWSLIELRLIQTEWFVNLDGIGATWNQEQYSSGETNRHSADFRWEGQWTTSALLNAISTDWRGRQDIRVHTKIRGRKPEWKALRVNVYRAF